MAGLPFNPFYNAYTTRQNVLAYVDGPDQIGLILQSGQFYTGRWGGWYNIVDHKFRYAKASNDSFNLNVNSDGNDFTYLTAPSSNYIGRVTNVSMAFDENAYPVMCYQDNGDSNVGFYNPPIINLATTGLSIQFSGKNAVLYNSVQTNYPYGAPNFLYPTYQTGDVVCYYSIETDRIYSRFKSEGFAIEHLMSSGIPNSGMAFANINPFPFINSNSSTYYPYIKVYSSLSEDGKILRLIRSKPTINFAADTFENYLSGDAPATLISGYGRWKMALLLAESQGRQFTAMPRIQDDYEIYPSGEILDNLASHAYLVYPQITTPTTGRIFYLGFLAEIFTGYATGYLNIFPFEKGFINIDGGVRTTSGRYFDPNIYLFELYNDYGTGVRRDFLGRVTGKNETGSNGSDGRAYAGWSPLEFVSGIYELKNLGISSSPFTGSGQVHKGNNDLITNNYIGYPYQGTGIFFNNHVFTWQRPTDPIGDFTMEIAVRPSGWVANSAKFIEANPVSGFSMGRYSNTGKVEVILNNNSYVSTFQLADNSWNFISFVRTGSNGSLYYSGILVDSFPVIGDPITGGLRVAIGKNFTSDNQRFAGYIDEFRFWNIARPTGDIYRDWHLDINPDINLLGYFSYRG